MKRSRYSETQIIAITACSLHVDGYNIACVGHIESCDDSSTPAWNPFSWNKYSIL